MNPFSPENRVQRYFLSIQRERQARESLLQGWAIANRNNLIAAEQSAKAKAQSALDMAERADTCLNHSTLVAAGMAIEQVLYRYAENAPPPVTTSSHLGLVVLAALGAMIFGQVKYRHAEQHAKEAHNLRMQLMKPLEHDT